MSKIKNDGLTQSGTGCFITAVPIWQQWVSKGQPPWLQLSLAQQHPLTERVDSADKLRKNVSLAKKLER